MTSVHKINPTSSPLLPLSRKILWRHWQAEFDHSGGLQLTMKTLTKLMCNNTFSAHLHYNYVVLKPLITTLQECSIFMKKKTKPQITNWCDRCLFIKVLSALKTVFTPCYTALIHTLLAWANQVETQAIHIWLIRGEHQNHLHVLSHCTL